MKWKHVIDLLVQVATTLEERQENHFFIWACFGHPIWHMKDAVAMKEGSLLRLGTITEKSMKLRKCRPLFIIHAFWCRPDGSGVACLRVCIQNFPALYLLQYDF